MCDGLHDICNAGLKHWKTWVYGSLKLASQKGKEERTDIENESISEERLLPNLHFHQWTWGCIWVASVQTSLNEISSIVKQYSFAVRMYNKIWLLQSKEPYGIKKVFKRKNETLCYSMSLILQISGSREKELKMYPGNYM
jgi:hypothetical protein